MTSRLFLPLLVVLGLCTTTSNSQWLTIDTLYSYPQCTSPVPYPATPVFVTNDTAYYYFNYPSCSPSSHDGYVIYRTSDSFGNWMSVLNSSSLFACCTRVNDLVFVNSNIGFLSARWSGAYYFFKTLDAGATWNVISFTYNGHLGTDLFFTDEDSGYLINDIGVLYKYYNDTINLIDTINSTSCYHPRMYFTDNNFGYILAGDSSFTGYHKVLKSYDGGATWTVSMVDSNRTFYDMAFVTDSIGYLAADTGLYITTDAGFNWTLMSTPFNNCSSISIVDNNQIFIIGSGGVYKTCDAGINWIQQSIPANYKPISIKMINDTLGFIHAKILTYLGKDIVLRTVSGGTVENSDTSYKVNSILIEPNPTRDKFTITIPLDFQNEKNVSLNIFNSEGKFIQNVPVDENQSKVIVNLKVNSTGCYIIVLTNDVKKYTGVLIVE